jgi:shikimate kinase
MKALYGAIDDCQLLIADCRLPIEMLGGFQSAIGNRQWAMDLRADNLRYMSIFLIGYRGCGKSTIGRRLADRLWQTFVDTDELIVRRAGKSIKEIFEQSGEAAFRELESEIVREVAALEDHVIALGGGAVLRDENRAAIQQPHHKIIYLKCDPEILHARICADANTASMRPNLTNLGGGIEEIRALLAEREPIYRQTMTAELDVSHLKPEDAVVYIVRLL